MKAVWKNTVIAESHDTIIVEGNHYFPPESIIKKRLRKSDTHTFCSWKGVASYYDVIIGDAVNLNAAWYYPDPTQAAANIKNYIAFWHGIKVIDGED